MPPRLFHVSDVSGIRSFAPRPQGGDESSCGGDALVWAIEERLLHNYLLPRDCPRVTYYATPRSAPEDVDRLLGPTTARHVVAIESRWLDAVRETTLYVYELPPQTFRMIDAGAGYHVSSVTVVPTAVSPVRDLLQALVDRGVELRIVPSLWPLRDAVVSSTLQYSCIRMRHATPRPS